MKNIVALLHDLETLFMEYADIAGKDIDEVGDGCRAFLIGKKVEAQNAQAANSNPTPAAPSAAASTVGGVQGNNPTTSGPAAA